jgi:hypothetical protein
MGIIQDFDPPFRVRVGKIPVRKPGQRGHKCLFLLAVLQGIEISLFFEVPGEGVSERAKKETGNNARQDYQYGKKSEIPPRG